MAHWCWFCCDGYKYGAQWGIFWTGKHLLIAQGKPFTKKAELDWLVGWCLIDGCLYDWLSDKLLQGSHKGDHLCGETRLHGDVHKRRTSQLLLLAGPHLAVQLRDKHLRSPVVRHRRRARIRRVGRRRSLTYFVIKYSVINFDINLIVTTGGIY